MAAAIAMAPIAGTASGAIPTPDELRAAPTQTRTAATAALQTLRQFTGSDVTELGFTGPGQMREAVLGSPLLDYLVQLDELRVYAGGDPAALLHATGLVEYPVEVQGQARSSITLARQGSQWRAVSFGAPRLSEARSQQRQALMARAPGVAAADMFQVRVPALNAAFVAQTQAGTLMLTPVAALPELGLKAGETEPARDMFLKLQPFASQIDPNVPR